MKRKSSKDRQDQGKNNHYGKIGNPQLQTAACTEREKTKAIHTGNKRHQLWVIEAVEFRLHAHNATNRKKVAFPL